MRQRDREKFVELANKRVNTAIKTIRLIGNLSNKSNYDYSGEDVEMIFSTLTKELRVCRGRFASEKGGKEAEFKLER